MSRHPQVPYAYAASLGVVADAARPSTKTSLKYTYTEDDRDDSFVPTMGSYLQASIEGAGESEAPTAYPVPSHLILFQDYWLRFVFEHRRVVGSIRPSVRCFRPKAMYTRSTAREEAKNT